MSEVAIGIDVGGTTTTFGFVERDGTCVQRGSLRTDVRLDAEGFVAELLDALRRSLDRLGGAHSIRGVGIGAPNANYFNGTVENAPNLGWEGVVPLARMVGDGLGERAVLTNDANAAALGEMLFGNARGLSDFLLVTLGTGVGSGFVVGGRLVYGHDGFAGELGHVIVEPGGRSCGCGRRGCLETYASVTGLVRTVREGLRHGRRSSLSSLGPEALDGRAVHDAAEAGDALAAEAFEATGARLGLALANAAAITSPAAIVLFGGLLAAGPRFLVPTKSAFEANLLNLYCDKIELRVSGLDGPDAAILGASALAWKEFEDDGS